ncbi:aldehyde ferredoxin oxidoreductase N-terminal domain-containing protein, partial [Chloroflexota bacterium]
MTENYGYTGKILRVDLSKEKLTIESVDSEILRKYIGGVGLASTILYGEVPPGVTWDNPENRLILATGPVNGTSVPGSGSFCVVTKGPLTNGAASSQANGVFGSFLKFSGFDAIVIHGSAPKWLFLYINNGNAELREADHLKGENTWDIEDKIKAELGYNERMMSVYSIGPAGENLVKFAALVGDRGHVAGHNGIGAVMGSKKLKAIAVSRGNLRLLVKEREKLTTLSHWMANKYKEEDMYHWGTSKLFYSAIKAGYLPVKNLTTNIFPEYELFCGDHYRPKLELKRSPCWACSARHCHIVKIPDGPYAGYICEEPDYETMAGFGPLIGQTDPWSAIMLHGTTDSLGLEGNEASWLMAMVME